MEQIMGTTEISTVSNITLVTLQGSPATTGFMAEVFERIAELDINIDMISMPPNHGANAGLSFTISDCLERYILNNRGGWPKDVV